MILGPYIFDTPDFVGNAFSHITQKLIASIIILPGIFLKGKVDFNALNLSFITLNLLSISGACSAAADGFISVAPNSFLSGSNSPPPVPWPRTSLCFCKELLPSTKPPSNFL